MIESYKVWKCTTCGDELTFFDDSYIDQHKYEGGNKCINCGYNKNSIPTTCQHKKYTDTYVESDYRSTGSSSTHEMRHLYARTCNDCGKSLSDVYSDWETEKHENDGNGYCWKCKTTFAPSNPDCKHKNKGTPTYTKSKYRNIQDPNVHEKSDNYITKCNDCGVVLTDYDTTWKQEPHSNDGNGYCWKCKSKSVGSGESSATSSCAHDYVVHFDEPVDDSGVWADNGDGTHRRAEVKYKQYCSQCGDQGPDHVEYNDVLSEAHNYSVESESVIKYVNSDEKGHKVLYEIIKSCQANSCSASQKSRITGEKEAHDFDENGACECGYVDLKSLLSTKALKLLDMLNAHDTIDDSYLFLNFPHFYFQEMNKGSWLENAYVSGYIGYSQAIDSLFDYSTPALAIQKMSNYLNMDEYANEVFAQMIMEYIYNFDAGEALSMADSAIVMEAFNAFMPGAKNIIEAIKGVELGPELLKVIKGTKTLDSAINLEGPLYSLCLSVGEEALNQFIGYAKAYIVREKIELGIGSFNSLPSKLQKELNTLLDECMDAWAMGLAITDAGLQSAYVSCIDGVIEHSLNVAGAAVGFPILGSVVTTTKGMIGQAVDSLNIADIGLGIEYIICSQYMFAAAENNLKRAARAYAEDPNPTSYEGYTTAKEAYRTYAATSIYWYYNWSVMEANSDIKFWKRKQLIKDAETTYNKDINKLNGFLDGI